MTSENIATRKKKAIEKLVRKPISWGREMKLLNEFLQKVPIDFFEFIVLDRQINSLAFFKTDYGREVANTEYKKFKAAQIERESFEKDESYKYVPVGEKKKTLKDKLGI